MKEFTIVNLNRLLLTQYLWNSNCGYHAIRNGSLFYLGKFKELVDEKKKDDDFNNYFNQIKKSRINEYDLEYLLKENYKLVKNYTIFIIQDYKDMINKCIKLRNRIIKNKGNIKHLILIGRNKKLFSHWYPIVIKNYKIYILDSFLSTWDTLPEIKTIMNLIFDCKKYKIKLKNKYSNLRGIIYFSYINIRNIIIAIIILVILTSIFFQKE